MPAAALGSSSPHPCATISVTGVSDLAAREAGQNTTPRHADSLSRAANCWQQGLSDWPSALDHTVSQHLMRPYLLNKSSTSERRTSLGRLPTYTVLLAMEAGRYLHGMISVGQLADKTRLWTIVVNGTAASAFQRVQLLYQVACLG
jgi:hypothetical protein